jgi:hypothetical protein
MKHYVVSMFFAVALLYTFLEESKALNQSPLSFSGRIVPVAQQPSYALAFDIATKKQTLGDYVSFPASGVRIQQPAGFEKDDSFDGFSNSETQSSIMATTAPMPYAKVNGVFTKEQLKTRGWILRSRQEVKVDNLPGILIHFEQPLGNRVFLKWSLVFGDDQKTSIVTATFPKSYEKKWSTLLKSAVQSSTRITQQNPPEIGASLPFTITAAKKMKLTQSISRSLTYTKDGMMPGKSSMDPIFIAVPSIGKVVVINKLSYAEKLIQQTPYVKKLSVKSTEPITIADLQGFESIAEAEDTDSGILLTVYQVILFDQDSYIRMIGTTGTKFRTEYLPEFKAMARSLQRK